jgi:hypothetical protein
MNREQIIQMAREAGGADISMNGWTSWVGTQSTDFLERFAKLVAEHERERILDICKEGLWDAEGIRYHLDKQDREQA